MNPLSRFANAGFANVRSTNVQSTNFIMPIKETKEGKSFDCNLLEYVRKFNLSDKTGTPSEIMVRILIP